MKPLDFLIIGAQKCATTTLFEHLRTHPSIAMPLEKEVPFFTRDDCSAATWAEYADEQFSAASQGQLWGKATPQYMCDPMAAARIKAQMPDVKLVAILRDPIERTWSHFKMGQRRDTEPRSFEAATADLLAPDHVKAAIDIPMPDHSSGYQPEGEFYISWSEYGRALAPYWELFSPDQLLVLYAEDLQQNPEETIDQLLSFIGLEPGFRPPALGQVIHKGGSKKRIPQSVRESLRGLKVLYWLWEQIPDAYRGRLRFRYEQWNISQKKEEMSLSPELQNALALHFARDLLPLFEKPINAAPWRDRYTLRE